jgi:hypothetical protein
MITFLQKIHYITSGVLFWVGSRYRFTRWCVAKYHHLCYNPLTPLDEDDLKHLHAEGPLAYFITGKTK